MSEPDEIMAAIGAAVERGHRGERAEAHDDLAELWNRIDPDGDALHRCTLAHHMADLQASAEAELEWDQRALAAADDLTDDRARRFHTSLQVRGFLPSLHLNLADVNRRLGHVDRARRHAELARDLSRHLPDDGYGTMIRGGIRRVLAALDLESPHSGT